MITAFQHGFRRGLFTVTQLFTTVHEFVVSLDKAGQTDVIFLDFCKALDKVPHGKLIFKLEILGLPSELIMWIRSDLANRKQLVRLVVVALIT